MSIGPGSIGPGFGSPSSKDATADVNSVAAKTGTPNITVTPTTGTPQVGISTTPTFTYVHLNHLPTTATEAATKGYVDSTSAGLSPKMAVVAVSTANIATLKGHPTIDTVATGTTKRVLLVGQTTEKKNGIWLTKAATGAWTRPATFAVGSSQQGSSVFVETGSAPNKGSGWVLVGPAIVVTTGTQVWSRNTPAGVYIPLTQKDSPTGVATLDATTKVPLAQLHTIPVAQGGTGATTAGTARTNLGLGTAATQNSTHFLLAAARGAATGVAELDATTKVPLTELHTIPLTKGGTGATTAAAARTALGLGTAAVDNATAFDAAGSAATAQANAETYATGVATTKSAAAQAAAEAASIPLAQKGAHTGVATLGATGKVPTTELPAFGTGTVTTVSAATATSGVFTTKTTTPKYSTTGTKLKAKVFQALTRIFSSVTAGTLSLRPNGPTSTTGQVQITTAGIVELSSGGGINSGSSVVYATHTIASGTAFTPTATRDCIVQWSTSSGTGTVKVSIGGHTLTTGARTYNGGLLSGFFSSNWNYFVPAGESITVTKTGGLAFTKMWIQKGV